MLIGPTGSGKSALALEIAARTPAVIINMDAMQMVAPLRILTARPTPEEEALAAHALYGVLAIDQPTSVAVWLACVAPVIETAWAQDKLPLLVGGTGMYLKALMEGLARVPPTLPEVRERVRAYDSATLRTALERRDPAIAERLKPGDRQRNARALEVIESTGVSLLEWQKSGAAPLFADARYHVFAVTRPREELYARIDARFLAMMEQGAMDEIAALMAMTQDLPPPGVSVRAWCLSKPPIYRAHGVPELLAVTRGEMSREEAVAKGQQHTRNYAKRQLTWLRNQLPDAPTATSAEDVIAHLASGASGTV